MKWRIPGGNEWRESKDGAIREILQGIAGDKPVEGMVVEFQPLPPLPANSRCFAVVMGENDRGDLIFEKLESGAWSLLPL